MFTIPVLFCLKQHIPFQDTKRKSREDGPPYTTYTQTAPHWKKNPKTELVFTWFAPGFFKNQPRIKTMFCFNLVFSWFFCQVVKITAFFQPWILKKTALPWISSNPKNCSWFNPGFFTESKLG